MISVVNDNVRLTFRSINLISFQYFMTFLDPLIVVTVCMINILMLSTTLRTLLHCTRTRHLEVMFDYIKFCDTFN